MKDELLKESVLEKFEIEREYWKRKEIDWGISNGSKGNCSRISTIESQNSVM